MPDHLFERGKMPFEFAAGFVASGRCFAGGLRQCWSIRAIAPIFRDSLAQQIVGAKGAGARLHHFAGPRPLATGTAQQGGKVVGFLPPVPDGLIQARRADPDGKAAGVSCFC